MRFSLRNGSCVRDVPLGLKRHTRKDNAVEEVTNVTSLISVRVVPNGAAVAGGEGESDKTSSSVLEVVFG